MVASCPACGDDTAWVSDAQPHSPIDAFEIIYSHRGERPLVGVDADVVERLARAVDEIIALEQIPVDGEELPVEKLPPEHFGKDRHLLHRETGTL